jgi:hypothetical protein
LRMPETLSRRKFPDKRSKLLDGLRPPA